MKYWEILLALLLAPLAALFHLGRSIGVGDHLIKPPPPRSFEQGGSLINKEASLTLLVDDANQVLEGIQALQTGVGGEILSSSSWTVSDAGRNYLWASLTLRLPVEAFNQVVLDTKRLSMAILDERISITDLTEQYRSLKATYSLLEDRRQYLIELLAKARSDSESQTVNEELLECEAQISRTYTQLQLVEEKGNYAQIFIILQPFIPTPTPTLTSTPSPTRTPTPWSPERTYIDALQAREQLLGLLSDVGPYFSGLTLCCGLPIIFTIWFTWRRHKR